jgi:predicted transcriptional regulator
MVSSHNDRDLANHRKDAGYGRVMKVSSVTRSMGSIVKEITHCI